MRKRSSKESTVNGSGPQPQLAFTEADSGVTLSQATSVLLDYSAILSLVLGGCCANVWSYEQLLIMNPRIGSALTFSQMMFITLHSLPSFITFVPPSSASLFKSSRSISSSPSVTNTLSHHHWLIPTLKPRQVPLSQWASQVLVHTTGSLLNNWAFAFNVPLTVLIVFRSAGLAVSMLLGFFILGRRYSVIQVLSVLTVSFGALLATLSTTNTSSSSSNNTSDPHHIDRYTYSLGILMVLISLFLTGILGVLQEKTYKQHGPCWKEGVFYTHLLSLPIFLFLAGDVKQGLSSLNHPNSGSAITSWLILFGNLVTQLLCVSGVNRLTSRVSSVSTNLVLTTRKAISLCLSVWWFTGGKGWSMELVVGAGMVFLGSAVFSLGGAKTMTSMSVGGSHGGKEKVA